MTSPEHPSGTDRIAEAIEDIRADVVVNIQGDEPLIDPMLIDSLVDALQADTKWDMATAAAPILTEQELVAPSVVKVVCGRDGGALYFSRSVIPHDRDGTHVCEDRVYWRHLGIYAYRRPFLSEMVAAQPCLLEQVEKLEQLRALYLGGRIKVLETDDTGVGVDTPEDLAKVAEMMRGG